MKSSWFQMLMKSSWPSVFVEVQSKGHANWACSDEHVHMLSRALGNRSAEHMMIMGDNIC